MRAAVRLKKRLSQHVMISKKWIKVMADLLEITPEDEVVEIGAGTGNLSLEIASRGPKRVVLIEVDPEAITILKKRLSSFNVNFKILNEDVRRLFPIRTDKVISNTPYGISSGIFMGLVSSEFKRCVITFQKEFADRLLAKPGTSDYGSLSVIAQVRFSIRRVALIGKTNFFPPPKVDSALLVLEPKEVDSKVLESLLSYGKLIFFRKKKKLRNSLRGILKDLLREVPHGDKRPYNLTPEEVVEVALWLRERLGGSD